MSTTDAPTQEQISELKGPALDDALARADIDRSTGGSRSDGSLTADEARAALAEHYCATEDASPVDDGAAGAEGDGTPDVSAAPEEQQDPVQDGGGDVSPNAEATTDTDENPNAPDPAPQRKSVDEQRDEQLEAGKVSGPIAAAAQALADGTPAEQRAGHLGARPTEGRVDNMTRRDDSDVLQGHFCLIDFGDPEHGEEAKRAVERLIGEGNAGLGSGDYGVYTDPGTLDEKGYPVTANVLLRDEHAGLVSGVPYGALRPAMAGRR